MLSSIITTVVLFNVLLLLFISFILAMILTSIGEAFARARARKMALAMARAEAKKILDAALKQGDPHDHFETHLHTAGEALKKGDLVAMSTDGLIIKAVEQKRPELHIEEVDLSQAPKEVQEMAAEMQRRGAKGIVRAIHVKSFAQPKPAARKRHAAKKKVITKKK